jgi:hypothetical protein
MEKIFFYPKLSTAYKNLDLNKSLDSSGITIFDVGANKGQSIGLGGRRPPVTILITSFDPLWCQ